MNIQDHQNYRPDIDGLRAVAILSVIFFHAFPAIVRGGFIGVDIFFVISGYLISGIILKNLKNNLFSFKDFYIRRIRRIFPALLIVLISVYFFGWFFLTPREFEFLNQQIAGGAGFISNFIFWRQSGYFDIVGEKKPLLHLWSLAVEEQFYIFWPIALWLFWRLKVNLLLATGVVALTSFALNIYTIGIDPVADFYSPLTRFWELLIGGVLATMTVLPSNKSLIKLEGNNALSILGLVLIISSVFLFSKNLGFPGWWALIPALGASMLIFVGSGAFINRLILNSKPMIWIGLISYPLYLWHWPILSLARIYLGKDLGFVGAFFALSISATLAWTTYFFIEKPIRSKVKGGYPIIILILALLAIGVLGFLSKEANGLPKRFGIPELKRTNQLTGCENIVKNGVLYPCSFGRPDSEKLILVYGDSHAGHLTAALEQELGKDFKFIFLGYGNCFQSANEGLDKDLMCQLMWQEVRRLRTQNIYAVIHAQRWGSLTSENEKIEMANAFKVAGLAPKKIAIVGSVPDVDLDCEIANYYIPSRKKDCVTNNDQKNANISFIRQSMLLNHPKNLQFFYPYQKLCPDDQCVVIDGATSYYWDDRHMSREGAIMSTSDLVEYLKN